MKITSVGFVGAGLMAMLIAASAYARESAPPRGCAAKQAEIEQRLERAREQGRKGQIAGLEKALAAHRSRCSDEGLRREREGALAEAQEKVRERERDLRAAQEQGRASKIRKRQEKLDQARRRLSEAEDELRK